jgi:DNA-binding transcriptional MerR regulator
MEEQKILLPGAAARRFNRSASWLKFLERQQIIPPAARDLGGRRVYSEADLENIRRILQERRRLAGGVPAA